MVNRKSKTDLETLGVVVNPQTAKEIRSFARENKKSISEVMRRAWRFASKHGGFLEEEDQAEQKLQQKFGPSRHYSPEAE